MLISCITIGVGVILYILFSKVKKSNDISYKENPFLGSESTNSYYMGVDIYKALQQNPHQAHFKGDHKRNV